MKIRFEENEIGDLVLCVKLTPHADEIIISVSEIFPDGVLPSNMKEAIEKFLKEKNE